MNIVSKILDKNRADRMNQEQCKCEGCKIVRREYSKLKDKASSLFAQVLRLESKVRELEGSK